MLLSQAVRVADARLAIRQFTFGKRFNLIQGLEVLERLRDAGLGLFFCALTTSTNMRLACAMHPKCVAFLRVRQAL